MQDPEAGEGTERARRGNVPELIPWEYPCSRDVGGKGEDEDAGDTSLSAGQDRQETLEEGPAEAVPGQPKECIEGPSHGRGPPLWIPQPLIMGQPVCRPEEGFLDGAGQAMKGPRALLWD